jgi:hypothetical protein
MPLTTLDLRADAIAEARRLIEARAFQRDGDDGVLSQCEGMGPLITRARRSTLRRKLAGQILLIWRVRCEDGAGRSAESRLVALLVTVAAPSPNRRRRAWTRAILRHAEASLRQHVDAAVSPWHDTVATVAGRFVSARTHRASAMAARLADDRPRAYQAGLFDRRAERARRTHESDAARRDRQVRARLTAALEAAPLKAHSELLLVLTP